MPATSQAFTPTSGTDGRVIDRTNGIILAGVQTWRRTGTAGVIDLPHFESPANADDLVQPEVLRGLGRTRVRLTGITNVAASTGTHGRMENGLVVVLDLLTSKDSSLGYQGVTGFVTNFEIGTDINDKACEFSAEVVVSGVFPAYGSVAAIA